MVLPCHGINHIYLTDLSISLLIILQSTSIPATSTYDVPQALWYTISRSCRNRCRMIKRDIDKSIR